MNLSDRTPNLKLRSSLNPSTRDGRLRELDGWRAVSVLLVIVHHIGAYQHPSLARSAFMLSLFEGIGPLGVKVFFIISGFVICRLLIIEEERFGTASLKAFYIRRVCRIIPPFYVYSAIICLPLSLGLIKGPWRGIFSGGFFLEDLYPALSGNWFMGHSWSLAVEEQFYLVFPTLWVLMRRAGRIRIFVGIFFLIAAWNVSAAGIGWEQIVIPSARAGFACICCGVLVASLETQARTIAKAVPAVVVAGLALILLWQPNGAVGWRLALYESIFVPPALALVLVFSLERGKLLRAFLCSRAVQAVGVTSYGIYLWQELFTAPAKDYGPSGRSISFLLPLLFAVVPLSYLFVEKPAMRLGKRLTERIRLDRVRTHAMR
jgi:peptidoglycan/LPS O-acetylase OafA/YrhL